MNEIELLLNGYRTTTIEVLYRMPDTPAFVQTFLWQFIDLPPEFPRVTAFVKFWQENLDGRIESIRACYAEPLSPSQTNFIEFELKLT